MIINKKKLEKKLHDRIDKFQNEHFSLPGIQGSIEKSIFVKQLIDSIRRIAFIETISKRPISPLRADPKNEIFDPIRAAILKRNQGDLEEAYWLTFLSTHFGRSSSCGWRLCRDFYNGYDTDQVWSWQKVSKNPDLILPWLQISYPKMQQDGVRRKFGNHRKFESMRPDNPDGTAQVIESYVRWISTSYSQTAKFSSFLDQAEGNVYTAFDIAYSSLDSVKRFGRLAKFDFLTMLRKLELVPYEPGFPCLDGSSGPFKGARLILCGDSASSHMRQHMESMIVTLADHLDLGILRMQVIEDALCNWQKSPSKYKYFGG